MPAGRLSGESYNLFEVMIFKHRIQALYFRVGGAPLSLISVTSLQSAPSVVSSDLLRFAFTDAIEMGLAAQEQFAISNNR
jgi:hypothetical protein